MLSHQRASKSQLEKALSPSRALRLASRELTESDTKLEDVRTERFSKEMLELSVEMDFKKREFQDRRKKLLELQDKERSDSLSNLSQKLEEKSRRLDCCSEERDRLERELATARGEIAATKRTLELERQERRELENRALELIKRAKRKWETAEREKLEKLNKHIGEQTQRITELCTSNNEMSSKLERANCELETAGAELHKLRIFQVQYKESLAKTRELNRRSAQGVESKLEEISARAHNQLSEIRAKFELETAKNVELEAKLRNTEDSNHCRQSRLNVALELAQSELRDCQEQLRACQAMIPARDMEIETLRGQLRERTKKLENLSQSEKKNIDLHQEAVKLQAEKLELEKQLEKAKIDLEDTRALLERNETLSREKMHEDKETLQKRLQHSLEKEEEQLRKVGDLEELLRRLESSVTKLEAENASLKSAKTHRFSRSPDGKKSTTNYGIPGGKIPETSETQKIAFLEHQVEKLELQLQSSRDKIAAERQTAKQSQTSLWKKEKELSDASLDKRIALREAKTAEERAKRLQEEKAKLHQQLAEARKGETEKTEKLLKELESAKSSLAEVTRDSTRNKLHAESAQKSLIQANKQTEELQTSNSSLRRELDSSRGQIRDLETRIDALTAENRSLTLKLAKVIEDTSSRSNELEKSEQRVHSLEINVELLKETCTVLEEQLTDYERLTSDHETRENTLIQERMKLIKDLEVAEEAVRVAKIRENEEKRGRQSAERLSNDLETANRDLETEKTALEGQRAEYKKLAQNLSAQVSALQSRCDDYECDLGELRRDLEAARAEAMVVKEESSRHLTLMHELKDANASLMDDLRVNVDQGQELRIRIAELESVLDDIRQFYQEREVKAEGTRHQQTKLIDFLSLKLEEAAKRKKTVCDKIFGPRGKENVVPIGSGLPIGYRELENQLATERAKVTTLTEQLLTFKAAQAAAPRVPETPLSPEGKKALGLEETPKNFKDDLGPDKMTLKRLRNDLGTILPRTRHDIPHRFDILMAMRAGKCPACLETIQFGKRSAVCSECQIITHLKCSTRIPPNCGLPGDYAKRMCKEAWKNDSDSSIGDLGGSVQTLAIDQPDFSTDEKTPENRRENGAEMASWVKLAARGRTCWERKYLRLEGSRLCVYEHQPRAGMSPIQRLELDEKNGFTVRENVEEAEVAGTASSDLPFVIRVVANSSTTCWPSSRLDILTLSQMEKNQWLQALKNVASQHGHGQIARVEKFSTVLKIEKHRIDLNCAVELEEENVILLGAEEGLFSYRPEKSDILTRIRGVKMIHQLSLHPRLGLGLMIAGEDRQLVTCELRQLRSNALAAECSRPAINTRPVLVGSESCHLYQIRGDMLCAATATHVVLLQWRNSADSGEFIAVRELETQEPCSCAIFTEKILVVGCHKFFQINLQNHSIDDFPEEEDLSSIKAALSGVARLGIFPVCVLDVSVTCQSVELLLCYNEFGVFVNESGQRTRMVDPTWSHLPFAFAFRKPYLFIVHFSSVEVIKLSGDAFRSTSKGPEKTLIELNNPRYLGNAGNRGIYVSAINSALEILRIDGASSLANNSDSLTSLETLAQEDESSSEFSFTSSLMEALDGQGKRVHFANLSNH